MKKHPIEEMDRGEYLLPDTPLSTLTFSTHDNIKYMVEPSYGSSFEVNFKQYLALCALNFFYEKDQTPFIHQSKINNLVNSKFDPKTPYKLSQLSELFKKKNTKGRDIFYTPSNPYGIIEKSPNKRGYYRLKLHYPLCIPPQKNQDSILEIRMLKKESTAYFSTTFSIPFRDECIIVNEEFTYISLFDKKEFFLTADQGKIIKTILDTPTLKSNSDIILESLGRPLRDGESLSSIFKGNMNALNLFSIRDRTNGLIKRDSDIYALNDDTNRNLRKLWKLD